MKQRALSTLFTLALFIAAIPLSAQFHNPDLPPDSVAWWTLTENLSPSEYRERYRSPLANLKRHRLDVSMGTQDPVTQEKGLELTFYVNGQSTPELVPMWYAFDVFATVRMLRETRLSAGEMLANFGASPGGVEIILDGVQDHQARVQALTTELMPLQLEYLKLQERAETSLGGDQPAYRAFRAAADRSDAQFLAPLANETVARTALLIEAAKANPMLGAALETLPILKQDLEPADWKALQGFLLAEIAPRMSSRISFSHREEDD